MRRVALILPCLILLLTVAVGQDTPDWATRTYDAPASHVYAAALKSIAIQKHEIKTKNDQTFTVNFHVGITAWSWGYNMGLEVTPINENKSKVTVGVLRSGGKVFSWGSGRKEVVKILGGIDAELASARSSPGEPVTPTNSPAVLSCSLQVSSEPSGADVELDGKFVGNTPATLRVKPGEYVVSVKKAGYKPWERKVSALADNALTLRAELEKSQ